MDYIDENFIKKPVLEYPNQVKTENKNVDVSVFMCTYNQEKFIRDAIEGILSQQTNFNFELLISEDESSDNTRDICIEYAKNHPVKIRLFLHNRENNIEVLGKPCGILPHVYNMLQARGKYIAVCAGDDYWIDKYKLQNQYDYLLDHSECSLVYQQWQEKVIKDDGSFCFGKILDTFPKASTSMFMNFKDKMPVQMLNVIQEDAYRWFILKPYGSFDCINNLKPVIVNTPEDSLTRSLSHFDLFKHNLNLKRNIYLAYKDTNRDKEAKEQYVKIIYSVITDKGYSGIRVRCLHEAFTSIFKDNLIMFTVIRVFQTIFK